MNTNQRIEPTLFDQRHNHEPIRTLFVSQIPLIFKMQDISDMFQGCLGFEKLVMYDNPKAQGKYFDAFVSFDTPENALNAMNELNNKPILDSEYNLAISLARQNTRNSVSSWNKKFSQPNFYNMNSSYIQPCHSVQNADGSYIFVPNSYIVYPNYIFCPPYVYYCNMPNLHDANEITY